MTKSRGISSHYSNPHQEYLCFSIKKCEQNWQQSYLEQQEWLHSEDTPRRLMITHIIESYRIPSQKKTKSKLRI